MGTNFLPQCAVSQFSCADARGTTAHSNKAAAAPNVIAPLQPTVRLIPRILLLVERSPEGEHSRVSDSRLPAPSSAGASDVPLNCDELGLMNSHTNIH